MSNHTSRREYLQGLTGTTLTSLSVLSTTTDDTTLAAADLLIPPEDTPAKFTRSPATGPGRFAETLETMDSMFTDADMATRGYWHGNTESDPEWVLVSHAIVGDEDLPRRTLEAAAEQAHDEYVAEYDDETSLLVTFEQDWQHRDKTTDWRLTIDQIPLFKDQPDDPDPVFTELTRYQYHGNTFLATTAFGPYDTPPAIDTLVNRYATLQRARYRAGGPQ
jgi:hypothetical protein